MPAGGLPGPDRRQGAGAGGSSAHARRGLMDRLRRNCDDRRPTRRQTDYKARTRRSASSGGSSPSPPERSQDFHVRRRAVLLWPEGDLVAKRGGDRTASDRKGGRCDLDHRAPGECRCCRVRSRFGVQGGSGGIRDRRATRSSVRRSAAITMIVGCVAGAEGTARSSRKQARKTA